MKKIYYVFIVLLLVITAIYDYKQPIKENTETKSYSVVTLEGAFSITGEYEYEGELTVKDLIEKVGVNNNANMNCLNLNKEVIDESSIYLPIYNENAISINKASQEELMELKGVGEKTAQKIIAYREKQEFTCLEDIMNVKGIGEKTFIKLRDNICL
jgi:competence protein ComEA